MSGISGRVWRTPARPLEPWESPEGNWTRSRLALAELQAVVDQLPPVPAPPSDADIKAIYEQAMRPGAPPRPAPTAVPGPGQKVSR